jgi:hypothetical protein
MPPKRPAPPATPRRPKPIIPHPPPGPRRPPVPRQTKRPAPPPLWNPPKAGVERSLAGAISVFGDPDRETTLLDLVDNLLSKGVVLHADAILALADVDLVYLRLTALLVAADRIFPRSTEGPRSRRGVKGR